MEIEPLAILSKRVVDIKSEKPEQLGELEKYSFYSKAVKD
jgi:hypothetical protein